VTSSKYKYKRVAAQAASLAELFIASFEPGLDGPVHFRVELSAPDGPSTAGGKQALQHVKLIPRDGGRAIVIGSADTTRSLAEIRTFDHIAALYAQRFRGAPIPVEAGRYNELGEKLANFFRSMRMQVRFTELEPSKSSAPAPLARAANEDDAPTRRGGWLMALGGVALALLVVVTAYVLVFSRR
jgi:hypothetical protein